MGILRPYCYSPGIRGGFRGNVDQSIQLTLGPFITVLHLATTEHTSCFFFVACSFWVITRLMLDLLLRHGATLNGALIRSCSHVITSRLTSFIPFFFPSSSSELKEDDQSINNSFLPSILRGLRETYRVCTSPAMSFLVIAHNSFAAFDNMLLNRSAGREVPHLPGF